MKPILDIYSKLLYYVNSQVKLARWPIFIALNLIISLYAVSLLSAHGGGTPQLINADIGPYWISTWVRPFPPETANFHLTIALSEPTDPTAILREAGPPILNETINIHLHSKIDPSVTIIGVASHEQAVNKFLYEADFTLPMAGQWQGVITIEGGAADQASIPFDVDVVDGSPLNIPMLIALGVGLLIVVVWLMRRTLAEPT